MATAQVVSGLIQTVQPGIVSELYRNDSAGQEKTPAANNDTVDASVDVASQFSTEVLADVYQGVKCFGVFKKDEELNGEGLIPPP